MQCCQVYCCQSLLHSRDHLFCIDALQEGQTRTATQNHGDFLSAKGYKLIKFAIATKSINQSISFCRLTDPRDTHMTRLLLLFEGSSARRPLMTTFQRLDHSRDHFAEGWDKFPGLNRGLARRKLQAHLNLFSCTLSKLVVPVPCS